MAKQRICMICKSKYTYCHTCRDYNPEETWRYLFDSYKCRDIYDIIQKYKQKEIDKVAAKEQLESFDDIYDIVDSGSFMDQELREILDIK